MVLRFSRFPAEKSVAYATLTFRRYARYKVSAESPRRGGLCITRRAGASPSTAGVFLHRLHVRELEVRARLLEVADRRVVDAGLA